MLYISTLYSRHTYLSLETVALFNIKVEEKNRFIFTSCYEIDAPNDILTLSSRGREMNQTQVNEKKYIENL